MPPFSEEQEKELLESSKSVGDLKKSMDALLAKLDKKEEPKPKNKPGVGEDDDEDETDPEDTADKDDLHAKVKNQTKAALDEKAKTAKLEKNISFNMGLSSFVKDNKDLLPNDFEQIVEAAGKENYDDASQKSAAVKGAMLKSFFSLQANMELLTPSQKNALDNYNKLTKNGMAEKADEIFENVLEPTLEMVKRIKKAEQVGRANSGLSSGSNADNEYRDKLIRLSKETHLREKGK